MVEDISEDEYNGVSAGAEENTGEQTAEENKPEEKNESSTNLISRRIVVTKPQWNGKQIRQLAVSDRYHVTITRVNRAGSVYVVAGFRL